MCAPALQALRGILWQEVFYRLRLWEFLQVSVDEAVEQFRQLLQAGDNKYLYHTTFTKLFFIMNLKTIM